MPLRNEDVVIEKLNESFLRIDVKEKGIRDEIYEKFTFLVPDFKFKRRKRPGWDGRIHLFKKQTNTLYLGLFDRLCSFLKENGYTWKTINTIREPDVVDLELLKSIPCTKTIRDYQFKLVKFALKHKKALLLSSTGSGKSLVIYYILSYLLAKRQKISSKRKLLVVVPTTSLVHQMAQDFKEYSNGKFSCHLIHEGLPLNNEQESVYVSTWQSIYKQPQEWFDQFELILGDEAHGWEAASLVSLMEKTTNTQYKIGTTGTIKDAKIHFYVLEGLFGGIMYQPVTTSNLIEKKVLSDLEIEVFLLSHANVVTHTELKRISKNYEEEKKYLYWCSARNAFISEFLNSLEGNTLVLFSNLDHGKILHDETIKIIRGDRPIFLVDGSTAVENRERVREYVDSHPQENSIIFGSTVFVTGINIVNLHNIVLPSPSKSKIRVLQSIGRGLRKTEDGRMTKVYDFIDDIDPKNIIYTKKYTLQHGIQRVELYQREKFKYEVKNITL